MAWNPALTCSKLTALCRSSVLLARGRRLVIRDARLGVGLAPLGGVVEEDVVVGKVLGVAQPGLEAPVHHVGHVAVLGGEA